MKTKLFGLAQLHDVLYQEQEKLDRPLKKDEARVLLQMSSGTSFPPEVTIEDIYQQLERCSLIATSEKYVVVKERNY